ncbi:MAG: hypothetical protein WA794_27600 [Trebonia sp.]
MNSGSHLNSHELAKARVADRHNQAQLNALARAPPVPAALGQTGPGTPCSRSRSAAGCWPC